MDGLLSRAKDQKRLSHKKAQKAQNNKTELTVIFKIHFVPSVAKDENK
jgi:hypothetical protein